MSEQLYQKNVTARSTRRLAYTEPGKATIEDCQLAELKDKNVIVRTLFSGISRGTENLVFRGLIPKTEWNTMRCPFQAGNFSFPVAYGYACVGRVIEVGPKTSQIKIGEIVFVLHPHQNIFSVPESACNRVPDHLPEQRAVLSANMETALNAVWDARITDSENQMVIGAGVVGLLTAFVIKKLFDKPPLIVDINTKKAIIAEKLGLPFATPSELENGTYPKMDRIFNTSASPRGLQLAIDHAAFEASVIEMSWYGDNPVTLKLGGAFHSQRLKIISSQVGHIAPDKRGTFDYGQRMQEAMKLLSDSALDNLLEPALDFEELPNHLHDIFSKEGSALCQLVRYTQD